MKNILHSDAICDPTKTLTSANKNIKESVVFG